MRITRSNWLALACLLGLLACISAQIFEEMRQRRIQEEFHLLSSSGIGKTEWLQDFEAQRSAQRDAMLVTIFLSQNTDGYIRADAFRNLAATRNPAFVGRMLALALRPESGLGTVRDVGNALQRIQCDFTCVEQVVWYLHLYRTGTCNASDAAIVKLGGEEYKLRALEAERGLHAVLQKNRDNAITSLRAFAIAGDEEKKKTAEILLKELGV